MIGIWVVLAVALTARASAGEAPSPGRSAYLQYCGACHGPNGEGDGIAGTFMKTKPYDLTRIAERSGGTFPFVKVMRFIDGTEDVRAHGDPDMPVWGEIFRDQAAWDNTRRVEVRGKLMVITDYLQSIQRK
jgi:mono/diheme cytochrome c family protein